MQQEPPVGPDRHVEGARTQEPTTTAAVEPRPQAALVVQSRVDLVPVPAPASRWRQSLAALRAAVP
ncbi:MAG: hypothetical protein M3P93_04650, partial [Actinomycetota bacterium]|nr:hypothetical protein [Actinomycetota bacterium]